MNKTPIKPALPVISFALLSLSEAELEDQLLQPKNDHLLFAYFGISLVIRRRSQATSLRAEIATKKKLSRLLAGSTTEVLVRSPDADGYPKKVPREKRRWSVYWYERLTHRGLELSCGWYHAFMDPATGEWDTADSLRPWGPDHPWLQDEDQAAVDLRARVEAAWQDIPKGKQGWFKVTGVIPYRSIVAIDDVGDDRFAGPHLYVPYTAADGPFNPDRWVHLSNNNEWEEQVSPDPAKRIVYFDPASRWIPPE